MIILNNLEIGAVISAELLFKYQKDWFNSVCKYKGLEKEFFYQYIQCWVNSLCSKNKLETYCTFKPCFEIDAYILKVDNPLLCNALTKLRFSAHNLAFEDGRYKNVEKRNRKCIF